jgi:dTDP-4-amino-4,6-dideoxygalactose transaminase
MSIPLLDLQRQYQTIKEDVDRELLRVVASQRFILGPDVEKLEREIAGYVGSKHAIACASGTDALLLPLKALQLEPGDEVITPAFTFFATAGAIWNAGLKPVFVDNHPDTFNISAETVYKAITLRTKAIIVVHLYGQMARMPGLLEVAEAHGLEIIEDAAQSLGARQQINGTDRYAGTFGTVGSYSFFPSKNLGGFGDGGLMVTNDDVVANRLRKLRVHGGLQLYHHELVGTNSRLDALQAAVLSAKLPHLDAWAAARRQNAAWYNEAFKDNPNITPPHTLEENFHVFNQYTLRVRDRDKLKAKLDSVGIGNAIYYPVPMHLQACFAGLGYQPGDLPVAEQSSHEAISIPVFPELTTAEREQVAQTIIEFYKG